MVNGLITVRSSSSRLPGKCFFKFGNYSVLEYVIRRAKYFKIRPIVCTTTNKSDDLIVQIAKNLKISYYRGSEVNKLLRWKECCNKFSLNYFHTIDADDLFFCPEQIFNSINILKDNFGFGIICPSKSSSSGSAYTGYSFTKKTINDLSYKIKKNIDTEMIEPFIINNKKIKFHIMENPKKYDYKSRMTLDYLEDYLFFETLRRKLPLFPSRKEIFYILKNNPDLIKINIKKNKMWKKNQKIAIKKITSNKENF